MHTFSGILLALHWLSGSCGFSPKNPCWFKSVLFFFTFLFYMVVQMNRQGCQFSIETPSFKASEVNLGCIQSPPMCWPNPTSLFFPNVTNSWGIFSHIRSYHCCWSWTGTAGEFTPFDPESCIAGKAGGSDYWGGRNGKSGWFGGSQILGTFILIGWLAFKVIMIIKQGRVSYERGKHPPFFSFSCPGWQIL